jgi:hypothetical protein
MGKKMTWREMETNFPDEWLLITDFDLDKSGHLVTGVVERHSRNKQDVYQLPALNKSTAFRYTGESTFSGLRNHARNDNLL